MDDHFTTPSLLIALAIGLAVALVVWRIMRPGDKTLATPNIRYKTAGRAIAIALFITVVALVVPSDPKPGIYFPTGAGNSGIIFLKSQKSGWSYLDAAPVGTGRIIWVSSFGQIKIQFDGENALVPLPFWNDQILVGGVIYKRSTKPPSSENYETEIGLR